MFFGDRLIRSLLDKKCREEKWEEKVVCDLALFIGKINRMFKKKDLVTGGRKWRWNKVGTHC